MPQPTDPDNLPSWFAKTRGYLLSGFLAGLGLTSTAMWEKGEMGQPNPSQWLPFGPQGSTGKGIIPPPGASW